MTSRARPITKRHHVLGITWEEHRRTRELCAWFGIPLHELTHRGSSSGRYARLIWRTLALLAKERPQVVYVQNPSLILATLVLTARPFLGRYKIVMDAHNEAVTPFTHSYWPITSLTRRALRRADVTIVTNEPLAQRVTECGGRPLVLPDRLPHAPALDVAPAQATTPFHIMVVATYAADEPIANIIEAARELGPQFEFRITGRETKLPEAQRSRLPANVKQTGFLPEEDYWRLMAGSHVVLDLTLKPDCLVCGAYEALALRRPMILSPNPPSVALFSPAAVFVEDHSVGAIAAAITSTRDSYAQLTESVAIAAAEFPTMWERQAAVLHAEMSLPAAPGSTESAQPGTSL